MARAIGIEGGYLAIVDDADFERTNAHRWHAITSSSGVVYAYRKAKVDGQWRTVYMHREVMGYGPGDPTVDHADGNGLDNRRHNLRDATTAENAHNARRRADNASGYKGVSWHKHTSKWRAQIRAGGEKIHLGVFSDPIAAARAWDQEARRRFGRFARLNFPEAVGAD